ncbi:sigma factor-like helix-turn-helix DNA-binding protein [Polymorphospora rubra]|uniref:sigma factor-like helix-turn-helix DNA-binding protein n=1 Tax=Polymorphospora rubra TaxID=338584 RepID=UPI001BB35AFA|nr:sigma factor-like helix-turn-helix DNA-binding protein [Polymorphospora rubra]
MTTVAAELNVRIDDQRHTLLPGQALTFGRDASCTVRLDATDLGISRTAGRVYHDGGWQVTNLSRKRTLHLVDAYGFATPLPVAAAGWPSSSRAVDHPHTTVLVAGQAWTYALVLTPAAAPEQPTVPAPVDPHSTRNQMAALTPRQRAVLVAMARGYLRPYPHYDPRPRTYNEVAERLGLTRTQVVRRVERVREQLVAAGVLGLEGEGDARRPLCEWLLAMRVIGAADLDRPADPDPAHDGADAP